MEPNVTQKMEDFLEKGNAVLKENAQSLKSFNRKVNYFIGACITIILFMLGMVMDTRVQVVEKISAVEVNTHFLSKKDALKIHIVQDKFYMSVLEDLCSKDSISAENYIWFRDEILNKNIE